MQRIMSIFAARQWKSEGKHAMKDFSSVLLNGFTFGERHGGISVYRDGLTPKATPHPESWKGACCCRTPRPSRRFASERTGILFRSAIRNIAIVLSAAARHLPLLFAVFMFYSVIATTCDTHPNLKLKAACLICKFCQNLSCGDDAAAAQPLPAPEPLQKTLVAECSSVTSKISLSPVGSRSPPFPLSSVEG